jgi:integrase/recombinase XerD
LRHLLVLFLGKERGRTMELSALSNEDLFERWRQILLLKYHTDRPRKEAYRVIGLFEKCLGGRRPSADLAEQYLAQFAGRSQNTLAGYYAQLAMFMKWYGDPIDYCRISPAEDMPELVDARDLDKIEEAIRNHKTHKELIQRDLLLVHTLRHTGLRRAEAAHLRKEHIDFAGRTLVVRRGKRQKDRGIPLLDALCTELQAFCANMRREDLVFGLKDVSVSGLVSIWARKAGVPHIHAHSYRHFFGTELARKGTPARAIMMLMGHKNMQTSQRYIDLVATDLRSAIDRLVQSPPKLEPIGAAVPSYGSLLDEVHWACQRYVQSQLNQLLYPPRHKFSWELQEGEQPSQEGLIAAINRS